MSKEKVSPFGNKSIGARVKHIPYEIYYMESKERRLFVGTLSVLFYLIHAVNSQISRSLGN